MERAKTYPASRQQSGIQLSRVFVRPRFCDFLGRFVVADGRGASLGQQSWKKAIAAADVQDAFVVQITHRLFGGGKMQPPAKGRTLM
jgi:hypothetical protein